MNDQDKLYLELNAKDNVSSIIEKITKDSEKLQQNFDNFKKITIKDIALKSDGAITAIKKQIQDSLNAEPFTISIAPDIDTSRVTEAVRAIVEAQDKILNASKGATVEAGKSYPGTEGATNSATQAARENAETVQQQAKSYEELRAQVDAVLGSLEKNTSTIVEERNAISLIDKEMKVINRDVEKTGKMTDNQRKRLEQLTAARESHKQTLQTSMRTLQNDIKLAQAANGSMNELNQSLGRMRMAYRAMTEEQRNNDFGKELLLSIQKADAKIKELDATIGNHQRNVGNYLGRSYNGLNMSLQQIVRELPNASLGFGMFTLAISNNIPILADQIKMAKEAAKAQKEMGQVTTPVWKQLLSSLFSWQTALILGVTLLTVYGKEIGEWAKSLFTGSRAAISAAEATDKLNEQLEKNDGKFSDNAISIKRLASEWKELKSEAEKTAWIEANQSAFEQMGLSIRDVTSAERAFVEYTPAVIEALKSRARAEAARELARDKYKEAFLKREKARQEQSKGVSLTDRIAGSMAQVSTTGTGNFSANQQGATPEDIAKGRHEKRVKDLETEADTLEKEVNVYYDIAQLEDEKAKAELKRLGIYKERNKTAKEQLQAQKANYQAQLDILSETEAAGAKGEELRKKISDLDKRLAAYSNTKTDKANSAANREATKAGEAAEKRASILSRQAVTAQRAAIDTEFSTRQAEIGAMEESTEKVLLQIKLDEEKRLEAIRREYEDLKLKRIEEAKKLWDADPKNKGVNFYESQSYKQAASDSQYTEAEKRNRKERENEVIASTKRATEKQLAIETEALAEYLKKYGTFEEARLALALQYTEKIRKAREKGNLIGVATAEAEQKAENARIDTAELKQRINWATVFDGFGIMLQKEVEESLKAMREYTQKEEFKALSIEEQKTFYDLIHTIEENYGRGSLRDIDLKGLGAKIERYEIATEKLKDAQSQAKVATEKLIKAQEENTKAQKSGTPGQRTKAQENLQKALNEQQQATEKVNSAAAEQAEAQYQVTDSATKLQTALSSVSNLFSAMASGSLSSTWEAFTKLDKSLNSGKITESIAKALSKAFEGKGDLVSLIIGAVLNLLDTIKEHGIGGIVGGLVQAILDAVAGLIKNIFSGKFVEQILTAVTDGIGNILDAITFGGWNSWFGGNSDEMQEKVDSLIKSNEALADRIERLTEKIGKQDSTNAESEEAYRRALDAEKEWEQNQRDAIAAEASAWTNSGYGFLKLGGKSSFNAHAPGAGSYIWEDFNKVLQQNGINKRLTGTSSLWNLTPEEMQLLRDFAPKAWRELFDSDGHRNPEELVNAYIERAGMLDQLTEAINEKLTGYSWDNFRSSFVDTLKDLTSSTEDFAGNIEDLLTNAILNSLINETYKDRIKALYDMIADAASNESEGGSSFTAGELQGIRETNEALAADLVAARNALKDAGVLKETSGSSSSRNSIMGQTITENTASLLSSYVNAIRASTAMNQQSLAQLLQYVQAQHSQMTPLAQAQLQQLQSIASNTDLIAGFTRQNAQFVSDIKEQLRRFSNGTDKVHIQ